MLTTGILRVIVAALAASLIRLPTSRVEVTSDDAQAMMKLTQARLAAAQTATVEGQKAFIVILRDAPLASYGGGIRGLAPTNIEISGKNRRKGKLDLSSLASRQYLSYLEDQQQDIIRSLKRRITRATIYWSYKVVLNALAVTVPTKDIPTLALMPEVAAIAPVQEYELCTEPTRPLVLDTSSDLMGADTLWEAVGGRENAGRGIKIGIIDTGVDFSNPMFKDGSLTPPAGYPLGDLGLASGKVIVAKVLQSLYDQIETRLDPGHRTAQDLVGHGSHVASCAAGSTVDLRGRPGARQVTISGIAPKAFIGSYRVFAPRAFSDNIIAAIEEAVRDGMDIINMSFGPKTTPTGDPTLDPEVIAVNNAVQAGVIACVAAGNSGSASRFNSARGTVGGVAEAAGAITVGASTNSHDGLLVSATGQLRILDPEANQRIEILGARAVNENPFPRDLTAPIIDVDAIDGDQAGLACDAPPPASLKGAIALVQRGVCYFVEKAANAASAGAVAVVFYNSEIGGDQSFIPNLLGASVPGLGIARSSGLMLKGLISDDQLKMKQTMASLGESQVPLTYANVPDQLASFSSRGPTNNYAIKPDLVTIGTGSYAAVQDDDPLGENRFPSSPPNIGQSALYDPSGFFFSQGTSFSSPRAAGAAALLKQLRPDWTPAEIKSALTSTARRPATMEGLKVMDRGSGLIDLAAAARLQTIVQPGSVSFGRLIFVGPVSVSQVLSVSNRSLTPTRYFLRVLTTGADPALSATLDRTEMRVLPGEALSFTLKINISADAALGEKDSEGFIAISDDSGAIAGELYIPFWVRVVRQQ